MNLPNPVSKFGLFARTIFRQAIVLFCLLLIPCLSQAEIYLELAVEGGGDTLGSTSDEDLNVAGGFKFAAGIQRFIGGFEDVGLLFTVGYLSDDIDASNGTAEIDAWVLDFVYFRIFGPHRIGTGGSYHLGPEYEDDLDGFARTKIDFDDALGLTVHYSYLLTPAFQLGARYTIMDYEAGSESLDADSFGIFMATVF